MTLYKYLVHLQTRSYLKVRKIMTAKLNSEERPTDNGTEWEVGEVILPRQKSHQLAVQCQKVSPENIHTGR